MTWTSSMPAMFGGTPAFPEGLPFVRPTVPDADSVIPDIRKILESGMLTNAGYVRELEARSAEQLGARHAIAVSSCTAGLMLLFRAAELSGDVVVPSFTFAATAHAVAWNGLRPLFADVDPQTLTLSAEAAERTIGMRTSAILATHIYGTPCDVDGLATICRRDGIRLFFDAAHAFGSRSQDRPVGGFGDAEVFSLSPTKVVVAAEGGIITTNDDLLAERCRIGRDYANPGDYDCRFVGLNARMSELHAAIALASLEHLEERIDLRNELVKRYRSALDGIPGIDYPGVRDGDRSTFKDFTLLIDRDAFGLDASEVAAALAYERIDTRRYYAPPVHRMRAYRYLNGAVGPLPVTDRAAGQVITLPLWAEISEESIVRVAEALRRLHDWVARNGRPATRSLTAEVERG